MPDHREPEADHPSKPPEASSRRPSRKDAIEAVSGLLSRKKPAFDRLATPSSVALPKFPRSLVALPSEWEKSPSLRAKFDRQRASIEPPPVNLPDGGTPEKPGVVEMSQDEMLEAESSGPSGPQTVDFVGTSAVSVSAAFPDRAVPKSVGRDLEAVDVPSPGGSGSNSWPIQVERETPGQPVDGAEPPTPEHDVVDVRREDLGFAEMARSGTPANSDRVATPEPARTLRPWASVEPVRSHPGIADGAVFPPASRADASPIVVRNPLATGLRDLGAVPRDFSGSAGAAPGLDESGPGGPPLGGPVPTGGGGGVDLSKTNEILRQLLDAVKRQREVSLPVGGPSIYSGR